jgi:hypothetical protein
MLQYPLDLGSEVYEKVWNLVILHATLDTASRGFLGKSLMWPILSRYINLFGKSWVLEKLESIGYMRESGKSSLKELVDKSENNSQFELRVTLGTESRYGNVGIARYDITQWNRASQESFLNSYQSWFVGGVDLGLPRPATWGSLPYPNVQDLNDPEFISQLQFNRTDSPGRFIARKIPEIYVDIAREFAREEKSFEPFNPFVMEVGAELVRAAKEYYPNAALSVDEKQSHLDLLTGIARLSQRDWAKEYILPVAERMRESGMGARLYAGLVLGPYRSQNAFLERLFNNVHLFSKDRDFGLLLGALATALPEKRLELFSKMKQEMEIPKELAMTQVSKRKAKKLPIQWSITEARAAGLVGLAMQGRI